MRWQSRVVCWYRTHRRDLPWRRTRDPYKIWISEVMLQQTTVETVIPYYQRFLKRFPTVRALARAREEEVLRHWSGLGYYARARNLRKAARLILARWGQTARGSLSCGSSEPAVASPRAVSAPPALSAAASSKAFVAAACESFRRSSSTDPLAVWPTDAAQWQRLPGVGRYTAGAIASIAFGERVPVVDGNVTRVLSRLFAVSTDPKTSEGKNLFWKKAEEILPRHQVGDFNQGLMELGATVCLPERPLCRECPLSCNCLAYQRRDPWAYPRKGRKKVYRTVHLSAAVICRNGKVLMVRRPNRGLLKGMWEFPLVEGDTKKLQELLSVTVQKPLSPIRHSVLNRRLMVTPYLCQPKGTGNLLVRKGRWFRPSQLQNIPTSSMNYKIRHVLGR